MIVPSYLPYYVITGGIGIVADDLVAAVMAGILVLGASMVGIVAPQ